MKTESKPKEERNPSRRESSKGNEINCEGNETRTVNEREKVLTSIETGGDWKGQKAVKGEEKWSLYRLRESLEETWRRRAAEETWPDEGHGYFLDEQERGG